MVLGYAQLILMNKFSLAVATTTIIIISYENKVHQTVKKIQATNPDLIQKSNYSMSIELNLPFKQEFQ